MSYLYSPFPKTHPEQEAQIQTLAAQRRLYVPCTGDNIVDANLIHGEVLLRNFVRGMHWTQRTLGYTPRLAVRSDAFGNSAQLPQILRGCGLKWVTGLAYALPKGSYWRGLDGSTVYCKTVPRVGSGGAWYKYAPCPDCFGHGDESCPTCGGSLIDIAKMGEAVYNIRINEKACEATDVGMIVVGGEELLPSERTVEWVHANHHLGSVFATEEEAYPEVEAHLARVDDETLDDVHPSPELNPSNTGCYVTRIKGKQTARRQEYALLGAEALSALAYLRTGSYPHAELNVVWDKYLYTVFHDCITSTYVDAVYDELSDTWAAIDDKLSSLRTRALDVMTTVSDGCISVFNPTGVVASGFISLERETTVCLVDENGNELVPLEAEQCGEHIRHRFYVRNVPPYAARTYTVRDTVVLTAQSERPHDEAEADSTDSNILQATDHQTAATPVADDKTVAIENDRYRIEADKYGLLRIFDKSLGELISEAGEFRPGEYILEHDEGNPWATLSCDHTRIPLSEHTRLIEVQKETGYQRLTFEILERKIFTTFVMQGFHIVWSVTLYRGVEQIEFTSHVDWEDYNHRIRIAFPRSDHGRAFYEIPYGVIERGDSGKTYGWSGYNGDWPAHNWAGIEGERFSTVLMNRGTPAYTVERTDAGDMMLLTVLRSPCIPTYLHEPKCYTMMAWDGMRDAGEHDFSYALCSYSSSIADSAAVAEAESYNSPLVVTEGCLSLPQAPTIESDCAYMTSLKLAEQEEDALILRIVEHRGKGGSVTVHTPKAYSKVYRTNMLEDADEQLSQDRFTIKPFEIVTLKFKR